MTWLFKISDINDISPVARGKALQNARKKKGLEQQDVARCLNVNNKNVSDWETGRVKTIPADKLDKWVELLGIDPEIEFRTIELPILPASVYRHGVVRELIDLALFAASHVDEDWVTKDFEYTRDVKNDMRELMEIYLHKRDKDTYKK